MRVFLVFIWALILIVCTCNFDLGLLVRQHDMYFDFDPNPDFSEMLKFFDYNQIHAHWIIVKIGHFIGFGMMYLLLLNLLQKVKSSIVIAVLFAAATEVLQLYFHRDGRLYDIGIDTAGILFTSFFNSRIVDYTDHMNDKMSLK